MWTKLLRIKAAVLVGVRVLLGQTVADHRQFRPSTDQRRRGTQARDRRNRMRSATLHEPRRILAHWRIDIGFPAAQPEPGGCDADNRVTLAVENHRHAKRCRISAEFAL